MEHVLCVFYALMLCGIEMREILIDCRSFKIRR